MKKDVKHSCHCHHSNEPDTKQIYTYSCTNVLTGQLLSTGEIDAANDSDATVQLNNLAAGTALNCKFDIV